MRFESREQRSHWRAFYLALIPDAVIAFVVGIFSGGGFPVFFGTFAVLWAIYFALFLKRLVWSWVLFKFSLRKEIADQVFYYLKKHKFPEPMDTEVSAVGYLERVMTDERVEANIRVLAAVELATLTGYETRGEIVMSARMDAAYEDGIERYKNFYPDTSRLSRS